MRKRNPFIIPSILKIVTVEDSPIVADRLQRMLSEMENVEFLGNACGITKANNLINHQKPNVVILDIHLEEDLPASNGINLLISLRKKYPDMMIIMFTNLAGCQYRNTCIAFGANHFFDKSVDFDKIQQVLKEKLTEFQEKVI
jgi:DNA-binding NarL/FixJ family response regulator